MVKMLKCFSININGRRVLNTGSAGAGHLGCLNGLRYFCECYHLHHDVFVTLYNWNTAPLLFYYNTFFFRSISMIWVALGHFYMFGLFYPVLMPIPLRNRMDAEKVD